MKKRALIVTVLALFVSAPAAAVALLHSGALTQLSGKNGCVAVSTAGCSPSGTVSQASRVTVSPDGKSVYVAGINSISVFKRGLGDGALSQLPGKKGCLMGFGVGKICTHVRAGQRPSSLALSPDGKNLYVTASGNLSVDVSSRKPQTGAIAQLPGQAGCVASGMVDICAQAAGLGGPSGVVVSPDGLNVYVTGGSIAAFSRDPSSGALSQLAGTAGCISGDGSAPCASGRLGVMEAGAAITISPDGKNVYAAGGGGTQGTLVIFSRDPATGELTQLAGAQGCFSQAGEEATCTPAISLQQPAALAISPGGTNVYVASVGSGGVAVFARDPISGALTQLDGKSGCVNAGGSGGKCALGRGLVRAASVTVSRDGKTVYVAAMHWKYGGLAVFARNSATGALSQLPGARGCYGPRKIGCTPVRGLVARPLKSGSYVWGPGGVTVSPDDESVYEVGGAIAVFSRKR